MLVSPSGMGLDQREQAHRKRLDLQEEVAILEEILDEELKLNTVLQCATFGRRCHIKPVPPQVEVLLEEIAAVEEEIIYLERKVDELKLNLTDRKHANEFKLEILHGLGKLPQPREFDPSNRLNKDDLFRWKRQNGGRFSLKSASFQSPKAREKFGVDNEEEAMILSKNDEQSTTKRRLIIEEKYGHIEPTPNMLSEELLRSLIKIFLKLNQSDRMSLGSSHGGVQKLALSCISSKSFISRASIINCKASLHPRLDPYGLFHELDAASHVDTLPYKKFVPCTRSSLDMTQLSHSCLAEIGRIRLLLRRYCSIDLSLLTYKEKLAFWINTYNGCILHAFMQHGMPSMPDKLLTIINKAVLNVGGILLNAPAIEHFILRHPCDPENVMEEKEALLRHVYGLGYPEPNVTFALCTGSWSSPALRIYTAEEVVTELEKAKVEYLEASVGITCKKKIVVPKLLHSHMHDFADNEESLLEWIYSQLPRSGTLKRLIMDCLNGNSKLPLAKAMEIRPFDSEFRYLLPLLIGNQHM